MHCSRIIAGLLTGLVLAIPGTAGSALVLSGADLLTSPSAVFPHGPPVPNGDSVIFENGGWFFNRLEYRLNADRSLPQTGTITIAAAWNLTRLSCQVDPNCLGNELDWDPHLLLTDGRNMLGLELNDNDNGTLFATRMGYSNPGTGINKVRDQTFGFDLGYPAIGESVEIPLVFTLMDTTTTLAATFRGVERSYTWNIRLGRDDALSLVLMQDNDEGERYQVNSLTVPGTAVPEPAALALLGLGLAGLGLSRRKQ